MVEAIEQVEQVQLFVLPDEQNLVRTLNMAWPYRKPRAPRAQGKLAIAESEEDLGEEKLVESGWARPDNSVKGIEQVGKGYEALKQKYARLAERI